MPLVIWERPPKLKKWSVKLKMSITYSGRTKYNACVSKLGKLSKQYICPQKTQKAPVFFNLKDFGLENDLKF